LVVKPPPETEPLTIQVSPVAGGTTTPAPGTYNEPVNSVVVLQATANLGYRFLNWTGGVASPTNPFTTVVMDQARTATANFALIPDFTFSAIPPLTIALAGSGSRTVTVNANAAFNQLVALSVSSPPSGFTLSLNPTSVTPPLGGSTSSQLGINLGASVVPGSYTFNVNGTSGTLLHSTSVSVTAQATTGGITTVITQDQALGCIDNAGISNALTSKLAAAQAYITAGDIQSAINTLTALLNQLNAQAGKHIKTTCTDANGNQFNPVQVLIADVQALLASLGANVIKPNPVMGYAVNSSNAGVSGVTVSIVNSAKTVVASATTDASGFYFFAKTSVFAGGSNYTVKVTPPKPYKSSTSPTFTWHAVAVMVANSVLN